MRFERCCAVHNQQAPPSHRNQQKCVCVYLQYSQLWQTLEIWLVDDGDVVALQVSGKRKRKSEGKRKEISLWELLQSVLLLVVCEKFQLQPASSAYLPPVKCPGYSQTNYQFCNSPGTSPHIHEPCLWWLISLPIGVSIMFKIPK